MGSKTRNRMGIMTEFRIGSRMTFRMHSKMGSMVTSNIGSGMDRKLIKQDHGFGRSVQEMTESFKTWFAKSFNSSFNTPKKKF